MSASGQTSVLLGAPIAGSIPITPVLAIESVLSQVAGEGTEQQTYLGWLDSADLARFVFAPLREPSLDTYFAVSSRDGYQAAVPAKEIEDLARALVSQTVITTAPVVLSGRGRWRFSMQKPPLGRIEVFHSAALVSGHREIGAFTKAYRDDRYHTLVPFVLHPRLTHSEEEELYDWLHITGIQSTNSDSPSIHALLPQLKIGTDWTHVEVISEPFVIMTTFGYAPVLVVQESGTQDQYRLYASARSLGKGLESIRQAEGRLTGTRICIRKSGTERTANYEVRRE